MIQKNSLVLYKKQPGIVISVEGDKFLIKFLVISSTLPGKKRVFGEQKVREKDIVLLHEKTVSSLEDAIDFSDEKILEQINETYLLLESDDSTKDSEVSFGELCEYIRNSFLRLRVNHPETSSNLFNSSCVKFQPNASMLPRSCSGLFTPANTTESLM